MAFVFPIEPSRATVCADGRKTPLQGEGSRSREQLIWCRKTRHQPHQPPIGPEMLIDMVTKCHWLDYPSTPVYELFLAGAEIF